jgi:hypothetical protein
MFLDEPSSDMFLDEPSSDMFLDEPSSGMFLDEPSSGMFLDEPSSGMFKIKRLIESQIICFLIWEQVNQRATIIKVQMQFTCTYC